MSLPAVVPIPPCLTERYSRTREGRAWLAALPGVLDACLDRWELALDFVPGQVPWSGQGSLVVPVLGKDGTPAALKIVFSHDGSRVERDALTLWNGSGAVRLLDSDAESGSLMLERLDADRSLQFVPMERAVSVWGSLLRQLSVIPDERHQWRTLDHVAAQAEQWSDEMPAEWERLGRPFPRWLLEAALEVCQTRGAVGRRSARDVLVNADAQFRNVLARPDGGGYAAIAPHPMIGEAEFAVAPMLWNRLGDLSRANPESALRERCRDISAAAGLDAGVALQWGVVRGVGNALACASGPLQQGGFVRSLWVASTLAGRTLDNLPSAHSLPEPDPQEKCSAHTS